MTDLSRSAWGHGACPRALGASRPIFPDGDQRMGIRRLDAHDLRRDRAGPEEGVVVARWATEPGMGGSPGLAGGRERVVRREKSDDVFSGLFCKCEQDANGAWRGCRATARLTATSLRQFSAARRAAAADQQIGDQY
jgi:hypothetical protein